MIRYSTQCASWERTPNHDSAKAGSRIERLIIQIDPKSSLRNNAGRSDRARESWSPPLLGIVFALKRVWEEYDVITPVIDISGS